MMESLVRYVQAMHPMRRVLTVVLLVGILAIPLLGIASAYQDYEQLKTLGQDAVHHLLAAKDALLPSSSGSSSSGSTSSCTVGTQPTTTTHATPSPGAHPTATPKATPTPQPTATPGTGASTGSGSTRIPDAAQLASAQQELRTAREEFDQLAVLLDRPDPTLAVAGRVPMVQGTASTARQLVYLGDDVTSLGINLITAASPILERLHNGALAASAQPLITPAEATQLRTTLIGSMATLNDIEQRISVIDPSQLPVNACQRSEYVHLTGELPTVRNLIEQAPVLFDAVEWLAGVGQPRQYLVQMMDRAELRPTGGFTGLLGVLQINGGRVAPFVLHDVNHFDYGPTGFGIISGRRPPPVYDWWPFGNWGLRDANLSGDFATSAQLILQTFQDEYGAAQYGLSNPNIDGVVQLTITPIQHVLQVTGPIDVPVYNEHVTAANVEQIIHLYQNNFAYIAKEQAICQASTDNTQVTKRKCFTEELGTLLENRVRQLSFSQLFSIAKLVLNDVKAHEIEIYVTDPKIEGLLLQEGYATKLATAPGQDTLMIDQANVSISKSSPLIAVAMQDDVVLDSKGGATHHVTITLNNNPKRDPVLASYSYITTYRDYMRVYVPAGSQLQDANGFDTGKPVCWVAPPYNPGAAQPAQFASLPPCWSPLFPDGSLVCPPGGFGPGPEGSTIFGADGRTNWAVEDTGFPTDYVSDVPGLTMFGGYVAIPEYCTARVTLTYYVPDVALPSTTVPGTAPAYTYLVERQAGTTITAKVTIHPAAGVSGETTQPIQFQGPLDTDVTVLLPRVPRNLGRAEAHSGLG